MSLYRCIYSSVASHHFRDDQLPAILTKARIKNASLDVTGMLVYINGTFLQILEGPEAAIDSLFQTISADSRHKRVFVVVREPITSRSFADWSMGFEALLPSDITALVGENDFFDSATCVDSLDAGVVKAILVSFRQAQGLAV